MSDVQEYAARLSQVIGPRPAGTEEEQQASFFIDEMLQEAGMEVRTEEFRCNLNYRMPRVIYCLFTVVLGFLSIFLNMLVLPAMIICLIMAVLFALDCFGLSPFANFGDKGLSQNIVARYEPPVQSGSAPNAGAPSGRTQRRRKVVLVANYDSGKVRRELKPPILGILHIIRWVELGAMVLVPLALLIRLLSGENSGPLVMFTNILTVIGVIGSLLVLLAFVTHQVAAYSDGANNNAAGVAVMLDVAKRIGESRNAAPQAAVVHGANEAYAAGVVPEGADLIYEQDSERAGSAEPAGAGALLGNTIGIEGAQSAQTADAVQASGIPQIPALSADSADILSLQDGLGERSGSPADIPDGTSGTFQTAQSDQPVSAEQQPAQSMQAESLGQQATQAAGETAAAQPAADERSSADGALPATSASSASAASIFASPSKEPSVPDWYKRAMSKANKSEAAAAPDPSKRSKFSDALDAAAAASRPEPEPVNPSGLSSDAEQRLQAMRESIMSGRPLSEATGLVAEGEVKEFADAMESADVAEAAEEVESIAAEPSSTHPQGVDGYLSNAMSSPSYEAGSKTPKRIISTNAPAASSAKAAQKEPRKKRSIMLPSLTGALKAVSADDESANPADSDAVTSSAGDNDAEVARIAARNSNKLKKANLAASLPALDGSGDMSDVSMSGATGSLDPITSEPEASVSADVERSRNSSRRSPAPEAGTDAQRQTAAAHRQTAATAQHRGADPAATISISQVGSFANAGMTGAFEPLGSEFVADMTAEEIYVDDADDSGYEENFTEHGALAGPGYVEMPKSRRERVFGKLRRKSKRQDDISFSEAMGIEDGYDARQVGKDRGGWESFRQGGRSGQMGDDGWSGGAYSADMEDGYALDDGYEYNDGFEDREARAVHNARTSMPVRSAFDVRDDIREFHEGPVQLEVWFVALGAELANNAGMKSFIAEHNNDLRGAMVVNINALGAGELTMIEREGSYRAAGMSSRLKRYVHKAGEALGIRVGTTSMLWDSSAAYVAERHGCQTLHLAGIKGGKPAYMAESDDVMSNLDPQLMEENAAFLMEFIRSI